MDAALEAYLDASCTPEDDYLRRLWRETQARQAYPRMASGHVQGLLLRLLVELIGARRVVEVGTFTGYSALAMASGMAPGGVVETYEVNDELEDVVRPWLEASPYAGRVRMIIGDVLQLLPREGEPYDLAFIDGNKRQYADYYALLLPRLRRGGLLVADNTLWDGHVVEARRHDAQTEGIRTFNRLVARDERVEAVVLPLRDGLTLVRKR